MTTKKNILYLVHRVPYPPDKGDRIRTFNLLRFLARRANVYVACLADEPVSQDTVATIQELTANLAIVPIGRWSRCVRALASAASGRTVSEGAFSSPGLQDVVRRWSGEFRFHAVLASSSSMVPYLRIPELADVPAVVDLIDVDSQKWLDYAASSRWPRAWLYRMEGRRLRQLERGLPEWAQAVTLVSDAEVDLYREFCLPGQIRAVPNGVDLEYFNNQQSVPARRDNQQSPTTQHAPLTGSDEPSCIFVGALDYHPNVDGATWFCREVWPRIHASCPRAKFLLVGRRPGAGVQRLSAVPGVEVVGQVPDVRPYLARATVAIAPLQIARGIQNKVLEAMAMAKPVIATPQSLVGLRVVPDKHLLCASNADQWQKLVLDLFTNKTGRQQLGRSARRYVEHNHGWDVCLQAFSALLDLEERQECFSQTPGTMPGHSSPSIAVVVSALRFISPDLTAVV